MSIGAFVSPGHATPVDKWTALDRSPARSRSVFTATGWFPQWSARGKEVLILLRR